MSARTPPALRSLQRRPPAPPAASLSREPAAPSTLRKGLVLLNESTKFVVSAAALAVLLQQRNAAASFALSGSVINSLAGKALKRVLNHARPAGARKADPGMPSSHALSLGYLATYGAAALLDSGSSGARLAALGLQALGLFLTALRVALGYHTMPQVIVGYGLGASNALILHSLALSTVLPAMDALPVLKTALYAATAAAIALFAAQGAVSWAADLKTALRAHR